MKPMLCILSLLLIAATGCAPAGRGIVALLTDYGEIDHYRGVLVANVLSANPQARIAEITHNIEPFNVMQGAFVLAESVGEFPPGTVVVAVVDPGVGTARAPIVVETASGRVIVGPDNGLLDLAIQRDGPPRGVWRIENAALFRKGAVSSTFHGRDTFAPVGGHLSAGLSPERVGPRVDAWVRLDIPKPARERDGATGTVTRIDYYGNCITNIPAMWLDEAPIGTPLTVVIDAKSFDCTWQHTYGEVPEGKLLALSTASGWVEIAGNKMSAAKSIGLSVGNGVRLRAKK